MKRRLPRFFLIILIVALLSMACSLTARRAPRQEPEQESVRQVTPTATRTRRPAPTSAVTRTPEPEQTEAAPAETGEEDNLTDENDGPERVTGELTYTNTFFTAGVAQPLIILEDQGGFVTRNRKFVIPVESQVIGEITSDFYQSPFTYSLSLPAEPNGTLHDVDNDGEDDTGVMVFAVAYWTNTWGDPYLERRDQGGGGWSTAYASTRVSDDPAFYREIYGGKLLVYAPDGEQQFPTGFGEDRKLFTEDDPVADIPQGWTVVNLDETPFEFDRSDNPEIDLLEPESIALDDFSGISYTEAFDAMVEKFRNEYAFTEYKKIDWDAKAAEFRPAFEQAEAEGDAHAYALALRDFIWSIPDSHVSFDQSLIIQDFQRETAGGLGFAMRETDDGRMIANFILEGGPADEAGMEWGAEIFALDGVPVAEVVEANVPWSSPFSNPVLRRLQQLRYALRFPLEKGQVKVRFQNPGGEEETVDLRVVEERESFAVSSFAAGQSPTALPVEFEVLPSGYGYVKINSFFDNELLTIQVWERALRYFNENQIPGVILDLRTNSGGSGWLANQMAAYFFDEEMVVGNTARYNEATGEFYMDPGDEAIMIPPRPELQYSGPVAVMVGPGCASACEFFSYNLTINDRAMIVGQYPSMGAGGSVEQFLMPENLTVQLTIGRAVDAQGEIHLEGTGVTPDVRVPVTVETLRRQHDGEDVILEAAIHALDTAEPAGAGVTPSGQPEMASQRQAEAALRAGADFLEGKAREQHDPADFAQPGTLSYTVSLEADEPVIWAYAWCAADAATLQENFENIELTFTLNGEDVTGQMATVDLPSGGQQCRLVYTALSEWPGGEHRLTTKATFTEAINDGASDFPAGDYILDYRVFVEP